MGDTQIVNVANTASISGVGVGLKKKQTSEMSVAMCYLSSTAVAPQPWEWTNDCAKNHQDFDDEYANGNSLGGDILMVH